MKVTFEQLYRQVAQDVSKWSRYKVPGMTQDEVRQEVLWSLWKAWKNYDETSVVKFHVYWHTVWMNHKANLIEAFFRQKRRVEVLHDPEQMRLLFQIYGLEDDMIPACPSSDPTAKKIWYLLSLGFSHVATRQTLGISKRRFNELLATMRRPSVRAAIVA